MKRIFLGFALSALCAGAHALVLDGSVLTLNCPGRGEIEVILHRYLHTQEAWGKNHFETGGGHIKKDGLLFFPFANLDRMIYDQQAGTFGFWYARENAFVRCRLVKLRNTFAEDIPYYRE